jgi:MEMO1 family protein
VTRILSLVMLLPMFWSTAFCISVRQPVVAGQLYPADSSELRRSITDYLAKTGSPTIDGQLLAIIVPHAGYVYSAPVAAYAYKLLQYSGVDKVILCGPSHQVAYQGIALYGPGISWKTPLGVVKCDDTLCNRLLAFDKRITVSEQSQAREHSIEVQLPFLQSILKDFRIVPIGMGTQDASDVELLAHTLESLKLDDHTILIASSDWQHYHPAAQGYRMDSLGMACLMQLDGDRLQQYLDDGTVEMCGGGPAVAVLQAAIARGANKVRILKYGDSGDITGDKSTVVGYVAVAIYKSTNPAGKSSDVKRTETKAKGNMAPSEYLSDSEKKKLLEIARQSIESFLKDGTIPVFDVTKSLARRGAAFVTLNEDDRLRGCIGQVVATEPLYKTISECAIKAATSDPRFKPVTAGEVPRLKLEISVLTPLEKVTSLDSIQVGKDGLMISLGGKRGLLLPQVATENSWSRIQFLEQTCAKAGLPHDAYRDPYVDIYKFQALVFGE